MNHQYTRDERAKLKQFQSIDYLAPSSRVYRQWLAAQPWGRYWDRWLMMALIGMAVGVTGFSLHFSVNLLAGIKYHATRWVQVAWVAAGESWWGCQWMLMLGLVVLVGADVGSGGADVGSGGFWWVLVGAGAWSLWLPIGAAAAECCWWVLAAVNYHTT